MLTLDKINVTPKTVTRGGKNHYITIKGSLHQEDTIVNISAPNTRALK